MNFFEQVYAIALKIPHGRVTSYGAIAAAIGSLWGPYHGGADCAVL